MKVFISWSGPTSKSVAKVLYEWLPIVLQSVKPFMSSEEIEKGARWTSTIAKELEGTSYGLICVTPDNLRAPWLYFEAGALAKIIEQSRVAPLLFNVKPSDIQGPLAQFQTTNFKREDFKRLIESMNSIDPDASLDAFRLGKAFNALWSQLDASINSIRLPDEDFGSY